MLTEIDRKVLDYLVSETSGAWHTARQIADSAGVFSGFPNRSKVGAMTALLKKLHARGHVEVDRSEPPAIWRLKRN